MSYARRVFEQCLYFNTLSLSRLLEREWASAFEPFGLSPSQAFLLRAVLAEPGQSQRALADSLTIARSTATRLIDGLVLKGLLERRASAADQREFQITPTRAARSIEAALQEASGAVTQRLKQALGSSAFAHVVGQLRGVRRALG